MARMGAALLQTRPVRLRVATACIAGGVGTLRRASVLPIGTATIQRSGAAIWGFGWCVPSPKTDLAL
jgi:hypothetical protein